MKKLILLIIIFFSQDIMSWGQSDTLSYESIMGYYKSKTNMIEFYQMAGNTDKVSELTKEMHNYIHALRDNYGKGYFYYLLSIAYYNNEDYENAVEYGDRANNIFRNIFGSIHSVYATSLLHLAYCYSSSGNYSEAIKLGTEAMEIKKNIFGTNNLDYARSLNSLANFYSFLYNYSEAIRLDTEAMEIRKELLGTDNLDYVESLNNLALDYSYLGNYSEAIRLGTEGMKILKKIVGMTHPYYTTSLNNLALHYSHLGNYSEAIRLDTEAMEIRKELLGTENLDYAESLNNLSSDYSDIGNYSEAIRLGTEAMEIRKKMLGSANLDYARTLGNLASYYCKLRFYPEAIRIGTEAMEIIKKVLGTEHPDYALSLSNISLYNSYIGNYSEAIRLGTEAMEIRKKILGENHPDYSASINNLSIFNYRIGNIQEAIRLGLEGVELNKRSLGSEHPNYVMSVNNLALLYSFNGNYQEAMRLGSEAIQLSKKIFGSNHPDYASFLKNHSGIFYNQGDYSKAFDLMASYMSISQEYLINSFSNLSSKLRESLWSKKYSFGFNNYLPSIVFKHQTGETVCELYDKTAIFSKGILLNSSIGMRKLIFESGDSILIAKYDALEVNKRIYDKQFEKPIKERILDIDSLHSVILQQEMELAHDSKVYGDFARNFRINWKDIQQRLGSEDVAIEFLEFPLYGTDSIMYVALTLRSEYDTPHITTLFEIQQLKSISEDNYYTGTTLYNLIWKSIEKELEGVRNIYFSPSGELHRIGIEFIPVTLTENICDKYNLHRVSSTRQLAYIQDEMIGEKSVLYGGLKYETTTSDANTTPSLREEKRSFSYIPHANVDSLNLRGAYKYLPGTKEEVDHIVTNLRLHSVPYIYYSDTNGTEESFKDLDGMKPKTLHIATHGFYLSEEDAKRKNFASPILLDNDQTHNEDKPMTRSGLLLSGCSRALNHENIPDGIEDGILTADEISKLDLRGLDLVVLSACQTGLGDITSGEGVFGLQRGFKNAGAKTIIMSLWKVSDIATQHLMTSFYNHYLSGMPKEQSFRMAQKELREMIGPGQNKPDWAAFVMLDGI